MQDFILSTKTMLQEHTTAIKNQGTLLQSHSASLRNLESQVGQIATALQERQPGRLPSDTEVTKPHGKEHCSAITLRSGTQLNQQDKFGGKKSEDSLPEPVQEEMSEQNLEEKDQEEGLTKEPADGASKNATAKTVPTPPVEEVRPPPPFPQRLKKHNDEIQFKKFVDKLDQLYINIQLLEAID